MDITGYSNKTHPINFTIELGEVASILRNTDPPNPIDDPVCPPTKSGTHIQAIGTIKNKRVLRKLSPPSTLTANNKYATAIKTEIIFPLFLLNITFFNSSFSFLFSSIILSTSPRLKKLYLWFFSFVFHFF